MIAALLAADGCDRYNAMPEAIMWSVIAVCGLVGYVCWLRWGHRNDPDA